MGQGKKKSSGKREGCVGKKRKKIKTVYETVETVEKRLTGITEKIKEREIKKISTHKCDYWWIY